MINSISSEVWRKNGMICLRRSVSFFSGTSDQTQEELVWLKKKERQSMNGLTMMILAVVVLGGAYLVYGRYLAKKWGINPDSKTPPSIMAVI